MNLDVLTGTLVRDGTSQEDRVMSALKEGFIHVDEMRFEDLLAMAADYARVLRFYGVNNASSGDWEPFVASDEAVIIAKILVTDLEKVESDFDRFLVGMRGAEGLFGNPNDLDDMPTYGLAKRIDFWFRYLPISDGLGEGDLGPTIVGAIGGKLREELGLLGSFLRQYNDTIPEQFRQDFSGRWFRGDDEAFFGHVVPTPSDDRSTVEQFLKLNFYVFYDAISSFQSSAKERLPDSLKSKTHDPAIALYIAFIKLYQKVQAKINRFPQRRLDFYYDDVLMMRGQKSLPDSTYLILTPDVEGKQVPIKAGTEFAAGVDEDGQDVIYTADHGLLVNSAQVVSLCTLYFARDPLNAPENKLTFGAGDQEVQFASVGMVNQIPVETEDSTEEGEARRVWPLFGAPKGDADRTLFEDAEIGFAIASPVLLLKEGDREINITFSIESLSSEEGNDLDGYIETLAEILGTSREDAFFRVFRQMFTIALTTEKGWFEVPEYLPMSALVDDTIDPGCLNIWIRLPDAVAPVVSYSPEIHGGNYSTGLPLIRFMINPSNYLYPYSLLQDVVIKEVNIEVEVRGVREMLLYNNLGPLDPNSPFNPFGPTPAVGSYFIVGNFEMAQKNTTQIDVDVEWGNLPQESGGFAAYYRSYGMSFDHTLFEVGVTALRDGRWMPLEEDHQQKVKLFQSGDTDNEEEETSAIKHRCMSLGEDVTRFSRAIEAATVDDTFGYSAVSKDGFLKLTLTSPDYAFGHKNYPQILTNILTANSKVKRFRPISALTSMLKRVRRISALTPTPNTPYTPLINVISLNYTAVSTIYTERLTAPSDALFEEKLFHIHPFGSESISSTGYRDTRMVPQYESDGNLFIGLSAPELSGTITLFFHLREDSTPEMGAEPAEFLWYYLASNQWKPLEQSRVVSDATNGFLTSGIVTLSIPEDINRGNSVMHDDAYWLRVSVNADTEALCSVYSVQTQALKVSWQSQGNALSHLAQKLPAGTITEPRVSIPGIIGIHQIVDSFGGKLPEDRGQVTLRTSERLKHKYRATAPWDYERLILEHFPEIFKVKCFSNMVSDPENPICPGHILIVVIPYPKEDPRVNMKPMVNALLLKEVKEFVAPLTSPF
ncbi:MAG: hypothetical protein QF879_15240, partial [Candidatus Latescibacteria bacterium]|nr:hypothetical protein [Candidatus Latescibacterota bacterium]